MTTGSLWRNIPLFAFPVAATSILEQLSNLIATVIIGNFSGDQGTLAMAAVGSNVPLTSLMLNLFIGMSLGSNVVIANAIGRNDQNMVKRAVHTSILMALVGFVVIALGEIFAEPMLAALNVPAETMPLASLYLRVFLLSMPSILLYNFEAAIFRAVGITRMPLQALAVSTVLNIGLDLIFVPVLHWGVAGVAITTAIAYTSGKPHIGNTYEVVLADAIARYKRQQGYDVFFQTGTDEHGQKIELKAEEAGITPKEFVDNVSGEIKRIWDLMNTSYDKFIRTTDEDHEKQVKKIFKKMYAKGDIYKGHYEGMYCTPCESFFTESQLVDGKCPDCGRPCVPAKEEAYFFKMSKYADKLIDYINTHPDFIQPESRKNEMMNNFLLPGLQDLCVSRTSFKWGIPVDFDPKHVVYVWLDALTNYITGIGYDCDGESTEQFNKLWPADLHLIGKDIIRFHTIYWPIFLMSLDLPLPKQVFGHPWLLQGDGKMSKSKGNVIYADELVDFFGVDAVRYFVLHEMPFENDGVITWELMVERLNSELANTLGNLVNRTISMSNKYFGGVVENKGVTEPVDDDLKNFILSVPAKVNEKMDKLRVADAMTEVFTIFKRCNKYIDETMPWALAKDEEKKDRLATVLYNLVEGICIGAVLL